MQILDADFAVDKGCVGSVRRQPEDERRPFVAVFHDWKPGRSLVVVSARLPRRTWWLLGRLLVRRHLIFGFDDPRDWGGRGALYIWLPRAEADAFADEAVGWLTALTLRKGKGASEERGRKHGRR